MTLPKGKLKLSDLERLVFPYLPRVTDSRSVLLDYGAAPITGNVVVASDPVLGIPLHFYGFFAVHYSATDVAMAWATPQYLSLGIYYPPNTGEKWLTATMKQLGHEAQELNLKVIGGHTGGYDGLQAPLIATTCFGILSDLPGHESNIRPEDVIVAVGPIGRETIWFLANIEPATVDTVFPRSQRIALANDLSPFRVVPIVQSLPREQIVLLHDIAEGGLATALFELQQATGLGMVVQCGEIPWDEPSSLLFNYLGWNPLYCSSFGTFLIVTHNESANGIIETIRQHGRKAAIIGKITKKKQIRIASEGKTQRLKPGEDPYKRFTDRLT
ncbi:MAG: AIR synthase-related protein [Promethearchaeota archaeon]